jgi:hypothetical protein
MTLTDEQRAEIRDIIDSTAPSQYFELLAKFEATIAAMSWARVLLLERMED